MAETCGAEPLYGVVSDLRRSSVVTTGGNFARPPLAVTPTAPAVVQGSKSYMDVSMSANKTSSSAKSERNPEGEAGEGAAEGQEEISNKPPGGSAGRASTGRSSALRVSVSKTPTASGLAPAVLQSLGGRSGAKCRVSGVGGGEVDVVTMLAAAVLVMAVGGPNSMSLRVEGKQSPLDEADTGTLGGEGNVGGGAGGGESGGVGGD